MLCAWSYNIECRSRPFEDGVNLDPPLPQPVDGRYRTSEDEAFNALRCLSPESVNEPKGKLLLKVKA